MKAMGSMLGMQGRVQQGSGSYLMLFLSSSNVMHPEYFSVLSPHRIPVPQQHSAHSRLFCSSKTQVR